MSLEQMSFSASVLILVIILTRALAINRLPKITFLILWVVVLLRLLIPFSLSSPISLYSIISYNTMIADTTMETPGMNVLPIITPTQKQTSDITITQPSAITSPLSIWTIIWIVGALLCAVYFVISYIRCLREFQTSIVVKNDFTADWLREHKIVRTISIRQSRRISAPLTYGIFQPVILVSHQTDWSDEKHLKYVLAHEYVHIRRFDIVTKVFLTVALCIHWFNPFVWAMYILANRDIELSCDEAVVHSFGETIKSTYAGILVSMEERKSVLTPYYNSFSKNAIEERIIAIMKIKKTSLIAVLTAIIMVAGITTVFATTAMANSNNPLTAIPDTDFTNDEYDKLLALQFEGYEKLSVADYREKVCTILDADYPDYMELIERMYHDDQISELRYTNGTASFLNNTLIPVIAENWEKRDFGNYIKSADKAGSDGGCLEYTITRFILDSNQLTVEQHEQSIHGFMDGIQRFWESKSETELQDEATMNKAIESEIERLKKQWETPDIQLDMTYYFMPLSVFDIPQENVPGTDDINEERDLPAATEAEYKLLLALKTADFKNKTVSDFNYTLLEWANENHEIVERISKDVAFNDIRVNLTDDELSFVTLTFPISNTQNAVMIRNEWKGGSKEYPIVQYELTRSEEPYVWYNLWYQISIRIPDESKLTIGERDQYLTNVINGMQTFWNEKSIEELAAVDEKICRTQLNTLVSNNSNNLIKIEVVNLAFEGFDERRLNN